MSPNAKTPPHAHSEARHHIRNGVCAPTARPAMLWQSSLSLSGARYAYLPIEAVEYLLVGEMAFSSLRCLSQQSMGNECRFGAYLKTIEKLFLNSAHLSTPAKRQRRFISVPLLNSQLSIIYVNTLT
jgi:hypothetical protein